MPAEGRENPLLKKGNSDAFFREKYLTKNNWEEIKLEQMYNICMAKFFQHPDLREKLLQTCCCPLFEGNTWGDRYWGTVNGYGENHLGIILMDIRAKLKRGI
ncbi:hypothetical protein K280104A7_03020 [Candidatus Bariatricus faecipullorum]